MWHVVHDLCVVDQLNNGRPAPCEYVNLADGERDGYAILKDLLGTTQYLLIATRPISGIESPDLLAPDAPNYWRAAWQARSYVSRRAKIELPREAVGMAINSAFARTQDQLHIHIDCVRPDVQGRYQSPRRRVSRDLGGAALRSRRPGLRGETRRLARSRRSRSLSAACRGSGGRTARHGGRNVGGDRRDVRWWSARLRLARRPRRPDARRSLLTARICSTTPARSPILRQAIRISKAETEGFSTRAQPSIASPFTSAWSAGTPPCRRRRSAARGRTAPRSS